MMGESFISRIIFVMLSAFLLVDAVNGYFLLTLDVDAKISVLYKGVLLTLLSLYLFLYKPNQILLIFCFCLFLMLGEAISVLTLQSSAGQTGFLCQHALKVVSPFLLMCFLFHREGVDQKFAKRIDMVLGFNCTIFIANIFAGIGGYGYSTYGGSVGEGSIGVKGFFYAGNEISAILVVFAGLYLGKAYVKSKMNYILVAIFWVIIGFSISTKTAILAVLLLVMATPLLFEGRKIFFFNNIPSVIFMTGLALLSFQAFSLYTIFQETALYGRMDFFFRNHGIIGVVLSGRDLYAAVMWENFQSSVSIFNMIFGNGVSYYADRTVYSTELDFADMFFWHGITGVLITLFIFSSLSAYAAKYCVEVEYLFARTVLLTNFMLLLIANLSGHIFTSGMLAFLWPCFAIIAKRRKSSANPVRRGAD